jgi:two-component system, chemotaxis family, protein-glutamate methylesterase/glutaminase
VALALALSDQGSRLVRPRRGPGESEEKAYRRDSGGAFAIVAVASSAGGLHALTDLLSKLPHEFPVPIVVVQHLDPRHRSLMAEILSRRTALAVKQAEAGESLRAGTVYVAPPDRHLLITGDMVSLADTELVHFLRPSADLLFESVAASYRRGAIAVVLTGTGKDGAMGVLAIKKTGGTVLVQSRESAEFPGMPEAAIQSGAVDFVLPLEELPGALLSLVMPTAPT